MRIPNARYIVQNLKSFPVQNAVKRCVLIQHGASFSTSTCSPRKESSSIRSSPKLDDLFPDVIDFPNRHIGPRKHETKAMLNEFGYNVSTHCFSFAFHSAITHLHLHSPDFHTLRLFLMIF